MNRASVSHDVNWYIPVDSRATAYSVPFRITASLWRWPRWPIQALATSLGVDVAHVRVWAAEMSYEGECGDMKLDGKVALVTGAAMGNGLGGARALARNGAHVVLADISEKVLDAALSLVNEGFRASGVQFDVRNSPAVSAAVKKIVNDLGRIDILFNNAGVVRLRPFQEMTDEDRDYHFDVNIKGIWNVAKAVYPHMVRQKYGKIVNMSSVTGAMVVDHGETAYATTKAAVWGFTKALAFEGAPFNITVNAVCPGYILTPMAVQIAQESAPDNAQSIIDGIAAAVPMKRLGTIDEIGDLVVFLASDESRYITGTQVVIDGGSTLPETFGAVGV
jgi:NAD(P)-dependent dehydrogenase (short-subunit alcohol dehydrogenase family)